MGWIVWCLHDLLFALLLGEKSRSSWAWLAYPVSLLLCVALYKLVRHLLVLDP